MKNKNVFIIGDSYSTYKGYIPEGYSCYYSDERADAPIIKGVEKTWWKILAKENDLNIVFNDSYSGSTICNTVREVFTIDSSFVSRFDKYNAQDFFAKNSVDTIIIFGGTNDSWIDCPIGNVKYQKQTAEDLKSVLPAFCYLAENAKKVIKNVVAVINTNLKPDITNGIIAACQNYNIKYVMLKDIDKENGHPTELGMKQIAEQISKEL